MSSQDCSCSFLSPLILYGFLIHFARYKLVCGVLVSFVVIRKTLRFNLEKKAKIIKQSNMEFDKANLVAYLSKLLHFPKSAAVGLRRISMPPNLDIPHTRSLLLINYV